ncbi:MAG: hypothetical protein JWP31_2738 [Aeromicrobium sp.]|nr:hypothetical protein [Aeromicrobium sp.]
MTSSWSARPLVILVLSAVLVVGVALGLVGHLIDDSSGGSAVRDSPARNQVVSRANDFAVAYNTYDVADLGDYQARLKGLLSPAYNKQFVEITKAVFGALKTKKQRSGDAKVRGVALESIDDDSAVAMVAVDASITNTDNAAAVLRNFRWRVSFTKTKDEWLVTNFESVATVAADSSAPTPTPSAGQGGS